MTVASTHVSYLLIASLVVNEYKVYSVFHPIMPLLDYFMPTSKGMHQRERHRKNTLHLHLPGVSTLYLVKLII